jgi:hypothetical protein
MRQDESTRFSKGRSATLSSQLLGTWVGRILALQAFRHISEFWGCHVPDAKSPEWMGVA